MLVHERSSTFIPGMAITHEAMSLPPIEPSGLWLTLRLERLGQALRAAGSAAA